MVNQGQTGKKNDKGMNLYLLYQRYYSIILPVFNVKTFPVNEIGVDCTHVSCVIIVYFRNRLCFDGRVGCSLIYTNNSGTSVAVAVVAVVSIHAHESFFFFFSLPS